MSQQSSRFFPPAEWKERCEHWRWTVLITNRTHTTSLNESKRCVSWFSWGFFFYQLQTQFGQQHDRVLPGRFSTKQGKSFVKSEKSTRGTLLVFFPPCRQGHLVKNIIQQTYGKWHPGLFWTHPQSKLVRFSSSIRGLKLQTMAVSLPL